MTIFAARLPGIITAMPFPAAVPSHSFLESDTVQRQVLGTRDWDQWQREWIYLKAGVALEQGEALMSNMAVDTIANISVIMAVGSSILDDAGTTFKTDAIVLPGMMVSISDGTGEGQVGIILEVVSETQIRIEWITSSDGFLDTATDVNSDAVIFAPWLAILATADLRCIGFAQIDVALNSFFWGLAEGIGMGRCDTSVAIAANTPLTIGDTAGQLTGAAATDLDSPCATAVHDNNLDGTLFPIMAGATPISAIPQHDRMGYAPTLT